MTRVLLGSACGIVTALCCGCLWVAAYIAKDRS